MAGFQNGREELRTLESVVKDQQAPLPQGDGDPRPLDEADPIVAIVDLDVERDWKIEKYLRDRDRAGL